MYRGRVIGIRSPEVDDLDVWTALAHDPAIRQLVVGWDWPVSRSKQEEWFYTSLATPNTKRLTVCDLETGAAIGVTGLWDIDWHNRGALSAVKLLPELTPKGAGHDTIMLMNAWAFSEVGLRRLHGSILDFNKASLAAYVRKSGWRVEGVEKESVFRAGEWIDLIKVAVLRHDFENVDGWEFYRDAICPVDINDKVTFESPDLQGLNKID